MVAPFSLEDLRLDEGPPSTLTHWHISFLKAHLRLSTPSTCLQTYHTTKIPLTKTLHDLLLDCVARLD